VGVWSVHVKIETDAKFEIQKVMEEEGVRTLLKQRDVTIA
jgi:hypothetical protein